MPPFWLCIWHTLARSAHAAHRRRHDPPAHASTGAIAWFWRWVRQGLRGRHGHVAHRLGPAHGGFTQPKAWPTRSLPRCNTRCRMSKPAGRYPVSHSSGDGIPSQFGSGSHPAPVPLTLGRPPILAGSPLNEHAVSLPPPRGVAGPRCVARPLPHAKGRPATGTPFPSGRMGNLPIAA